jgi:integrase
VNTLQEKVQPQTARNAYQRLRTALGLAVKWRQLSENPAVGVDVPSSSGVPIRPLNASQATALLEAVRGHRLAPLYDLALGLGLRQGELLGLRWSNVDLDKGVLRVAEQMQRLRSRETVKVKLKTPRSERELPLSEELISRLRAHRENQDQERRLVGERWKDYDLVFPSEVGTVIMARNLVRHFKAALQRAKLPSSFRFHDLRHTAATLMLAAGVPLKTVSDILGHSSIQVTADTYGYTFERTSSGRSTPWRRRWARNHRPRRRSRARTLRRSKLSPFRRGMSRPDAALALREAPKLLPRANCSGSAL